MAQEGAKKPMFYLSWDASGMYLWLGSRPKKSGEDRLYRQVDTNGRSVPNAVRMRLPVSWFGGLVDEGGCREFDPEITLGEAIA